MFVWVEYSVSSHSFLLLSSQTIEYFLTNMFKMLKYFLTNSIFFRELNSNFSKTTLNKESCSLSLFKENWRSIRFRLVTLSNRCKTSRYCKIISSLCTKKRLEIFFNISLALFCSCFQRILTCFFKSSVIFTVSHFSDFVSWHILRPTYFATGLVYIR